MAKEKTKTDHDLLIEVRTDVGWLVTGFGNHLKHHQVYTVLALGAAISGFTAAILLLVRILWT